MHTRLTTQYTNNAIDGFTLVELLIALAILGVIATFMIPKLLQSQSDQKKKAVFRETIATLSDITYSGWLTGELNVGTEVSYFDQHLNAIKICNNSFTEGCWPQAHNYPGWGALHGYLLANGASLIDFQNNNGTCEAIIADWDGASGANVEGDDQIRLFINFGTSACGQIKAGTIGYATGYPNSQALWEEIFR